MDDKISNLINKVIKFRDERDWKQFHNPKDLAISLSLEASELLECFQWKTNEEVNQLLNSPNKIKVEEEIADVALYLLLLCNETQINLEEAILNKINKNNLKYPVDKSKGNAKKYTEL